MTLKLYSAVEQLISDGLNHRYSGAFTKEPFAESQSRETISNAVHSWQLRSDMLPETIETVRYRLPQSRIFCTRVQEQDVTMQILEYFSNSVLLITNHSPKPFQASITVTGSNHIVRSGVTLHQRGQDLFQLTVKKQGIVWLQPQGVQDKIEAVTSHIHRWRANEYENHPLSVFFTDQQETCRRIDALWASIPEIGPDGLLQRDVLHKNEFKTLLALQEIYISLGWFDQLSKFYLAGETGLNDSEKQLYRICYQRLQQVNWIFPNGLAFAAIGHPELDLKKDRYLGWLVSGYDDDEPLVQSIQEDWEFLSLNAAQRQLKRLVQSDPDEYIAFWLLVNRLGFWWTELAANKLIPALPFSFRPLFELISIMHSRVCWYGQNDRIRVKSMVRPRSKHELFFTDGSLTSKISIFGRRYYTHFGLKNQIDLKVDKPVEIEINPNGQNIKIDPIIFKPPLLRFNPPQRQSIDIGSSTLDIPLVWDQFTIWYSGVRLRFLRKKNRFQLSIQLKRGSAQPISINNTILVPDGAQYHKIHIPILKRAPAHYLELQDNSGWRLKSFGPHIKQLTVRGYAFDAFNILKDDFNYSFGRQKSNKVLATNAPWPGFIAPPGGNLELTLFARKCSPYTFSLPKASGRVYRLLEERPEALMHRLQIVLADRESIKQQARIRQQFWREMSFYPEIMIMENRPRSQSKISLVLIQHNGKSEYFPENEMRGTGSGRFPECSDIVVTYTDIGQLFTREFWKQLCLNKFDFR